MHEPSPLLGARLSGLQDRSASRDALCAVRTLRVWSRSYVRLWMPPAMTTESTTSECARTGCDWTPVRVDRVRVAREWWLVHCKRCGATEKDGNHGIGDLEAYVVDLIGSSLSTQSAVMLSDSSERALVRVIVNSLRPMLNLP